MEDRASRMEHVVKGPVRRSLMSSSMRLNVEGKRRGNPGGGTEISDAACDRCAA